MAVCTGYRDRGSAALGFTVGVPDGAVRLLFLFNVVLCLECTEPRRFRIARYLDVIGIAAEPVCMQCDGVRAGVGPQRRGAPAGRRIAAYTASSAMCFSTASPAA
jgi:hypothetical protein